MENDSEEISSERFGFTVFLSACVHAILILGVGFTYMGESESEPAMEITLAQYRSEVAPEDADFLAQENQLGSGTLEQAAAPSTPFDSDFNADTIQQTVPVPQTRIVQQDTRFQDSAIITTFQDEEEVRQDLEEVEQDTDTPPAEETTAEDLSVAIASLQAQLDRQRQEYARRPRKYTISSASTKQSHDALYLDKWRRRIEAVGNINYPEAARQQRIYGSLRMMVSLLPDGKVMNIEILRSSGHAMLDQAAVDIVNLAAPFDPFPEELIDSVDILEIIRTWRFHEGDELTSF